MKLKLPESLGFLKSVRFYKLVLAGIVQALVGVGALDQGIATPIIAVLLGSVVVRTVDRNIGGR